MSETNDSLLTIVLVVVLTLLCPPIGIIYGLGLFVNALIVSSNLKRMQREMDSALAPRTKKEIEAAVMEMEREREAMFRHPDLETLKKELHWQPKEIEEEKKNSLH